MHINVEHREEYAVLHLRGEFDTYYCRDLQEEIDALAAAGTVNVILNLRLVKFINSTALGAIIKASKMLNSRGGRLALTRPSAFCQEIIEKVGLDRVVPIYDSDDKAAAAMLAGSAAPTRTGSDEQPADDPSIVLFTPVDPERIEHFVPEERRAEAEIVNKAHGYAIGSKWNGIGRMLSLDERGLHFTWSGGDTGLDAFAIGQLLAIGTELKIKFRMPMLQHGYVEAITTVGEIEEREDGVKIGASFTRIDDKTLAAVRQYSTDLKFLKDELRKATGR